MTNKETDLLKHKLAYYKAFHAKACKTSFIHQEVVLYLEKHAREVSGFDSDGTPIRTMGSIPVRNHS